MTKATATEEAPPNTTEEQAKTPVKLCSKCGKVPASGSHDWCKACKAKYQREYTGTVIDVAERRGVQKGIQTMRNHLVELFRQAPPGGMVRTGEVADFIAGTPAPRLSD